MMLILIAFILTVLSLLAFLCSASETAVTAASRTRLLHLEKKGEARATEVLKLQQRIGQVISTILLANTWTITCITAVTSGLLTQWLGPAGAVYAAIGMSLFITIFLEVMPKIYVYNSPEAIAMKVARALNALRWALLPVTYVIDNSARLCLYLFGAKLTHQARLSSSLDELKGAIDLYAGEAQASYERAMLRSILELTQVRVADVMVHRSHLTMLCADDGPQEVIKQALSLPYTRIPVWRHNPDNVVGILHTKSLLRLIQNIPQEQWKNQDVSAFMLPAWFIPESTTLFTQLQLFREKRSHLALVVDEYGALSGIITLEDILEEIVGDILDEKEGEISGVTLEPQGSYLVQGRTTLRDLNRLYEWDLPTHEASTLGGLVIERARYLPRPGQVFYIAPLLIQILKSYRHHVSMMRVYPVGPNQVLLQATQKLQGEHGEQARPIWLDTHKDAALKGAP